MAFPSLSSVFALGGPRLELGPAILPDRERAERALPRSDAFEGPLLLDLLLHRRRSDLLDERGRQHHDALSVFRTVGRLARR